MSFQFRISHNLISLIVHAACKAIYVSLKDEYLHVPSSASEAEWRGVAREFEEHWQFPRCIVALDGKHVV